MTSFFPLPIEHAKRTDPCDFIPTVPDPTGSGERMWKIVGQMKLTQGARAGEPFKNVACPWQEKLVRTFWSEDENGQPLFDELFLLCAKKQGKSELSGKLMLGQALFNPIQRGNEICIAATQEQAKFVYDSMATSVESDSFLKERFLVRRYRSDICDTKTGAILRAAAPEAGTLVGVQPAFYVVDELHILGNSPKAAGVIRQLSSGAAVFDRAKGITITTAPLKRAEGIYQSTYNRAKRILAGESEGDRMLPIMFELPDECLDDIENHEDKFWMANPSMGSTFSQEWFMSEYRQSRNDHDPSRWANFLSQHLNINAGEVIGVDQWIPMDKWDALMEPYVDLEWIKANCDGLIVSADAGASDDPTSCMVLGEKDDLIYVWCQQYLSEEGYKRREGQTDYDAFIARGELVICPVGQDLMKVMSLVDDLHSTGKLRGLSVDPYKMKAFKNQLESSNQITVYDAPQNWKMGSFIAEADRLIYQGKIRHNGNHMLRWNMGNARLVEKGNAVALEKPQSLAWSKDKIDGAITLIMCLMGRAELPKSLGGDVSWMIG